MKYGDLPNPVAATGEVLVNVVAASVNGADWKARSGQYSQAALPLVLGRDFSGFVAAAAVGVDDPKVGDAVFGVLEAALEGAYAERLAIKAAIVAKKPDGLSHVNERLPAELKLDGAVDGAVIPPVRRLRHPRYYAQPVAQLARADRVPAAGEYRAEWPIVADHRR